MCSLDKLIGDPCEDLRSVVCGQSLQKIFVRTGEMCSVNKAKRKICEDLKCVPLTTLIGLEIAVDCGNRWDSCVQLRE